MPEVPQQPVGVKQDVCGPSLLTQRSGHEWRGGDFAAADLRGWCLAQRQLQYANFRGANLCGVSFWEADARGAIFDEADLTEADFTGALVQGACFRRARLCRASFRQALLLSAHLEHAWVQGATFTAANLEWAWVDGVDFQAAVVSCAVFLNARGLSRQAERVIEAQGGFTGTRSMILGRELYENPLPGGSGAFPPGEG